MLKKTFAAATVSLLLAAGQASADTITFEDLAEGETLSNQYDGVTFKANAFTGNTGPTGTWATNTGMRITNSMTGDVGGLGEPPLVSGNILRAFGDTYLTGSWLSENGDPSFLITFATPISSISADFAGVNSEAGAADVRLIAYDGASAIGEAFGTTVGQFTLSFTAASITSVVITPGSFDDWVGVDNISYTAAAVPEVSTYAMMALGMGLLAFKRRKAA